ncbi:hypothetical protein ACRAWF_18810 [Streptomyces sp. L7]
MERGVDPSAEVLAELVPQLVAVTQRAGLRRRGAADPDDRELPRVPATAAPCSCSTWSGRSGSRNCPGCGRWRAQRGDGTAEAALLLRQLGELAVRGFPGTILPNPLVRELGVLARQSGLGAPLVEELAADIFMNAFGPKFLVAAGIAGELLGGSLYEAVLRHRLRGDRRAGDRRSGRPLEQEPDLSGVRAVVRGAAPGRRPRHRPPGRSPVPRPGPGWRRTAR